MTAFKYIVTTSKYIQIKQGKTKIEFGSDKIKKQKIYFCSSIGMALFFLSLSLLANLSFSSRTVTAIAEARSPAVNITQSESSRIKLQKISGVEWNHNDYLSRNPFKAGQTNNLQNGDI